MEMKKPFLKWAGDKVRLSRKIKAVLPTGNRLVEPFIGAGSIFLNTNYSSYVLSDANADLINIYQLLKDDSHYFIDYARQFFAPMYNTQEAFTERRVLFNTTSDICLKSALFIYMNKHCFNGLCRYNASGGFNVPFGRYAKPAFPEAELLAFAEKTKIADFQVADFRTTMRQVQEGDVVYCDPPYVPLTETAKFTNYTAAGFTKQDQEDLTQLAIVLRDRGIPVLISNHDTKWVREQYASAQITEFEASRSKSCDGDRANANKLLALFI